MICLFWLLVFLVVIGVLFYRRINLPISLVCTAVVLVLFSALTSVMVIKVILWLLWLFAAVLAIKPLRRHLITVRLFKLYRKVLPAMSATEREALEAGTVWWDSDLFSGKPNWSRLLDMPKPQLSEEEQAFLDGPVEKLCGMINDWEIVRERADLPEEVWQFLREQGFFGLIIPKAYGGKEFSALAHLTILVKIFSTGITAASTVAVPNSLGPAELLLHYGTEEQKNHYLPRLAKGEEMPCFALTSPHAGSDAGSLTDYGIVCKQVFEGEEVLGMRLTWDKRYITLAPIATVLGLAFKLYDPEHLLGEQEELGITCALIPTSTPGVIIGDRHIPAGSVFQNGPTQGQDVFVPLEYIIGGAKMAGQGWRMLMECLAVGRSISLPSSGVAGAKFAAFTGGAYSRIRRQFNMPIGVFEGVEEILARIVGSAYQTDAVTRLTVQAIDRGEKPSVLSAIVKYHCTEMGRQSVMDALDVHGGKGVCLGPSNYLAAGYQGAPVGITVEGANLLTRNMIIFGQGAVRCHPYVLKEMHAAQDNDLSAFDDAFFGHIGFTVSNSIRSFVLGLTHGYSAVAPKGKLRRYYQQITRFSASFAFVADVCMGLLGGELKRRERLSARLGDVLSYLYLASATLKHYIDQGQPKEDFPIVRWTCEDLFYKSQQALDGILANFPVKWIGVLLRGLVFPLGRRYKQPSDKLSHKVAALIINETESRQRLAKGLYVGAEGYNQLHLLSEALTACIAIEPIEKAVRFAVKQGKLSGKTTEELMAAAVKAEIVSADEFRQWTEAVKLRDEVIKVDAFKAEDLAEIC